MVVDATETTPRRVKTKTPGILRDTRSGRYVVRARDAHGRQVSRTFDSLGEAKTWQAAQRVDPSTGPKPTAITFAEYAATWIARHPQWAPGTRESNQSRVDTVCQSIGGLRLDRIVAGDIVEHLAKRRAAGIAPSTIAAERNTIASVMRAAVDDRLITWNPASPVKAPKVKKNAAARSALLTPEQITALVDNLNERYRTFAWLIAWTGLRGGEAAGLTVDRVDFLHNTITIDRQLRTVAGKRPVFGPPKTPSSVRVLPMGESVKQLLTEHVRTTPLGADGLLFTTRTHAPVSRSVRSETFRLAADGLDLPEAARGWHALRHTYGSTLLANGVDVVTVSAWLGHNGPAETLATYAHVNPDNLVASADVAAQALRAAR